MVSALIISISEAIEISVSEAIAIISVSEAMPHKREKLKIIIISRLTIIFFQ